MLHNYNAKKTYDVSETMLYFGSDCDAHNVEMLLQSIQSNTSVVNVSTKVKANSALAVKALLSQLEANQFCVIDIKNPMLNPYEFRSFLAAKLEILTPDPLEDQALLKAIYEKLIIFLSQGKRILLMIPNAYQLKVETLDFIRWLSGLMHAGENLIQVVFFDLNAQRTVCNDQYGADFGSFEHALSASSSSLMVVPRKNELDTGLSGISAKKYQGYDSILLDGVPYSKQVSKKKSANVVLKAIVSCLIISITLLLSWIFFKTLLLSNKASSVKHFSVLMVPTVLISREVVAGMLKPLKQIEKTNDSVTYIDDYNPVPFGVLEKDSSVLPVSRIESEGLTANRISYGLGIERKNTSMVYSSTSRIAQSVESLLLSGKYPDALALIAETVGKYEDSTFIILRAANILMSLDMNREAILLLEQYKNESWSQPSIRAQLVILYNKMENFHALEKTYLDLIGLEPEVSLWVLGLANLYDTQQLYSKALVYYQRVLRFRSVKGSQQLKIINRIRELNQLNVSGRN